MIACRSVLIACLLAFVAASASSAVILDGSLRTTLYSQESVLGPGALGERGEYGNTTRLFETVRLDALRLGHNAISFHTAFTGTNVLTHESIGDTRFRLYRGYLQAMGPVGEQRVDARIGRQWVLAGVGTGVVDGLSLRIDRRGIGEATGFFGSLGSDRLRRTDRFWSLDSPEDSHAFGGRVRVTPVFGALAPRLAVSYSEAHRTFDDERVRDNRRLGAHVDLRTAPSIGGPMRNLRAWGDFRRDLMRGRTLGAAGGLDYLGRPVRMWGEYISRRPDFSADSFFATFRSRSVEHVRAGIGVLFLSAVEVSVDGDLVTFQGNEDSRNFRLLVGGYGLTGGWSFQEGYGGDLNGLVLFGRRDVTDRVTLDASLNHTLYEYGEEVRGTRDVLLAERTDETATSALVGLTYRVVPRLSLTGQVERLENRAYDNDWRFLGIVNWRFRTAF